MIDRYIENESRFYGKDPSSILCNLSLSLNFQLYQ
jgi:hypothetical protein